MTANRSLALRVWLLAAVAAFALLLALPGAVRAEILASPAASCDPSKQSCAPGGGSTPLCEILGTCPSGGGGGGGSCPVPPGGGSPNCGGSGPASVGGGGTGGVSVGGGNPINLLSGNKYQEETDLAPLPGVLGLELKRHYNSLSSYPGLAGAQWATSYETVLYDLGHQVQIVQADGRRITLQRGVGANARLCTSPQPQDGQVRIEGEGKDRVFHWRWADGRTLSFRSVGPLDSKGYPLHSITAATGERMQLAYSPLGDLLIVTDPQGRKLVFAYGKPQAGKRVLLQSVSTPLGQIHYRHDELGRLTQVMHLLPGANKPHVRRLYHYEAAHQAGNLFGLTGISVQAPGERDGAPQRLSTYAYETSGRAILSTKGRPLQKGADGRALPGTGIEQITLNYVQTATPNEGSPDKTGEVQPRPQSMGRVQLTNSLGQVSELKTAVIGGQLRLIEFTGAGCSTCGPANRRYGYDTQGRLLRSIELDVKGQPLSADLHRYDRWGRLSQRSRQAYSQGKPVGAPQWLQRFEYADLRFKDGSVAVGQQPTLIAQPSVVAGKERITRLSYNAQGQVLRVSEAGWSPINDQGQDVPTALERQTEYRYSVIAGKSVLSEIDGPLPNGPKGAPEDSDVTRFAWDGHGLRMTALLQPGGRLSEFGYEASSGRVAHVRNEVGARTAFRYDASGQPTSLRTDGPGWPRPLIQSLQYDALGRLIEWGRGDLGTGAYRGEQRLAYDVADRLILRAQVSGSLEQFAYDTESRPVRALHQAGFIVQREEQEYDEQGRVIRVRGAQGRSLQLRYDDEGRPSLWIDALGRVHRRDAVPADAPRRPQIVRDDWGRQVQTRSPDAGVSTRWFDAAHQLVAGKDALGNRARYVYDAAGRILEQHIQEAGKPAATVTRWRYDGRHLVALEHAAQSERYTHDARGLVLTRTVLRPGLQALTRYAYDEEGRLLSQTLPDGSLLRFTRDGLGQVVALSRERVQTAWLRWLLPTQTLASDMKRDGVDLREVRLGNGLVQTWERGSEGALARLVLRDSRQAERLTQAEADRRFDRLMQLLGMANAQANTQAASQATPPPAAGASSPLPGALGLPREAAARLDHRYLWDAQGNLLLDADPSRASSHSYAYDHGDRLVIEAAQGGGVPGYSSRWLFDRSGRRLLQQMQQPDASELQGGTQRVRYAAGTHRWLAAEPAAEAGAQAATTAPRPAMTRYDAQGQPLALQDLTLSWDALGRLSSLSDARRGTQAHYRYNHRGERIAKQVGPQHTQYLYQDRRLSAELDAQGRLQRQYLYLDKLPLAVIDTPQGQRLQDGQASVSADLSRLWQAWFGKAEQLIWLHANHLGAVELATDAAGHSLWQGQYNAHGALLASQGELVMNLRLPGQVFDAESGLHYNDHRYYDPQRGEYLSPDPLGTPDGPNAYSYVRGNPLRYVDPEGLILFAFDGTGNTDNAVDLSDLGNGLSNVVKFRDLYNDGSRNYVTGVGTRHRDPTYGDIYYNWGNTSTVDMGTNKTGPKRIDRMVRYFIDEADGMEDEEVMEIDIVGFSRGAAQARDFANRIVNSTKNGYYQYKVSIEGKEELRCQKVNFRFMGLFDTVLSTNWSGQSYDLGIPDTFQHVSQAVALNEYRGKTLRQLPGSTGAFPLESILDTMASPVLPGGKTRTERGFLGSHADIGGGFATENELARVALAWMVEQANAAGVKMNAVSGPDAAVPAQSSLHDKSDNQYCTVGPGCSEDREVRYQEGAKTKQRNMAFSSGMEHGDTGQFVSYYPPELDAEGNVVRNPLSDFRTGTVDMKAYVDWLKSHGYNLGNLAVQ